MKYLFPIILVLYTTIAIGQIIDKNTRITTGNAGAYLGEKKPGSEPQIFSSGKVSKSNSVEFGSTFSKNGLEFYFARVVGNVEEIWFTEYNGTMWTLPKSLLSSTQYSYCDPILSPGEQRLYFISTQTFDSSGSKKDYDIWYSERTVTGWSAPINAGSTINTEAEEYYVSFTQNGKLYFASNKQAKDGLGSHDIYYSNLANNKYSEPINIGFPVNSASYEADVFVARDESYIIFSSNRAGSIGKQDLWISFRTKKNKWTTPQNLGNAINTPNDELCPFVTHDGKFLFYTSKGDIYWVNTSVIDELKQ